MFSSCTVPPNKKGEQLGSSNQEASPSAGKTTGIVLVTCRACKYPYRYFRRREFFGGPWLSLLRQTSSQWGSQKLLQGFDRCLMNLKPGLSDFTSIFDSMKCPYWFLVIWAFFLHDFHFLFSCSSMPCSDCSVLHGIPVKNKSATT